MNVKRLTLLLGLAGFIVMADNWVVAPLLPSIAHGRIEPGGPSRASGSRLLARTHDPAVIRDRTQV